MSRTLNLADRVLTIGRNLRKLGRDEDALHMLGRLAGWQHLPPHVAEEAQVSLAEIRLRHGQFAQARPHLAALLVHQPANARYHYLLAAAFDAEHKSSAQTAYEHYRRSLELDPEQADCLSDFGLLALRLGKEEEGLQALRRAVALAPDNTEVVGKLAEGLRRCGQSEEARLTLRAALFRNPRNRAFHKLWNDFRFRQVCAAQQEVWQTGAASPEADEPVLLPLVDPASDAAMMPRDRKVARRDRPSPFSAPHTEAAAWASDRKRA